jgi:hypothetical protein
MGSEVDGLVGNLPSPSAPRKSASELETIVDADRFLPNTSKSCRCLSDAVSASRVLNLPISQTMANQVQMQPARKAEMISSMNKIFANKVDLVVREK